MMKQGLLLLGSSPCFVSYFSLDGLMNGLRLS